MNMCVTSVYEHQLCHVPTESLYVCVTSAGASLPTDLVRINFPTLVLSVWKVVKTPDLSRLLNNITLATWWGGRKERGRNIIKGILFDLFATSPRLGRVSHLSEDEPHVVLIRDLTLLDGLD